MEDDHLRPGRFSNIQISVKTYHTRLREETMWLISTRFFQLGLHQNQLAVGWQLSSHRVQSDSTFQAGHPLVIKSKQVLINDLGQAIELRHLQCIITHADDVTVWFQEVDPQDIKRMGCLSGCLMSSASVQKLFCGICSAFK